jgi:hypothetical protein
MGGPSRHSNPHQDPSPTHPGGPPRHPTLRCPGSQTYRRTGIWHAMELIHMYPHPFPTCPPRHTAPPAPYTPFSTGTRDHAKPRPRSGATTTLSPTAGVARLFFGRTPWPGPPKRTSNSKPTLTYLEASANSKQLDIPRHLPAARRNYFSLPRPGKCSTSSNASASLSSRPSLTGRVSHRQQPPRTASAPLRSPSRPQPLRPRPHQF